MCLQDLLTSGLLAETEEQVMHLDWIQGKGRWLLLSWKLVIDRTTVNRLRTHLKITTENSGSSPLKSLLVDTSDQLQENRPQVAWGPSSCDDEHADYISKGFEAQPKRFQILSAAVFQHLEGTCCYYQWPLLFQVLSMQKCGLPGQHWLSPPQPPWPGGQLQGFWKKTALAPVDCTLWNEIFKRP